MAKFHFRKSIAWFVVLLILILVPIDAKIDAEIDLAVIWASSSDTRVSESMKNELKKLSDMFVVNDTKVKIAIVDASQGHVDKAVVVPLSGQEFANRLENWKPIKAVDTFNYHTSFEAVRRHVFENIGSGTRARVIIVLQQDHAADRAKAFFRAIGLREANVRIYVITDGSPSCLDADAELWTGDATRCIDASSESGLLVNFVVSIKKLEKVILVDLCNWKTACRFSQSDQKRCVAEIWQFPTPTIFDDDNAQCNSGTIKPTSPAKINCNDDRACDRA